MSFHWFPLKAQLHWGCWASVEPLSGNRPLACFRTVESLVLYIMDWKRKKSHSEPGRIIRRAIYHPLYGVERWARRWAFACFSFGAWILSQVMYYFLPSWGLCGFNQLANPKLTLPYHRWSRFALTKTWLLVVQICPSQKIGGVLNLFVSHQGSH